MDYLGTMAVNQQRRHARDGRTLRFLRTILVAAVLCPSSAFVRQIPSARHALRLHGSVASSIITGENGKSSDGDDDGDESEGSSTKGPRLSRPERKAQERADKHTKARRRKHNFVDRQEILQEGDSPTKGRYELHSTIVGSLNQNSTADDVVKAIKRAQNLQ
jgi:hypothetical protein